MCSQIHARSVFRGRYRKPAPTRRSKRGWNTRRTRDEPPTHRRPSKAAWRARARRQGSRIRSGSARSRIDAGWIPHGKGCWRDSRWGAICFWSITRAGCFAKAVISGELSGIFARLGSSAESWWARLEKLSRGRLLGRFFAASRARLRSREPFGPASRGKPGRMPGAVEPVDAAVNPEPSDRRPSTVHIGTSGPG